VPTAGVVDDPLNAVQAAFFAAARADSALMALLPGGVYDEAPESENRDYLMLGDHLSLPDHTHDKYGREITQTFHIWTKARGTKRGAAIAHRWNALFDHQNGSLSVPGHRIVLIRNEFQQALRDPDPEWRQTLMRFRINTEQLP
jgi:uncharacterized protein DUF3168